MPGRFFQRNSTAATFKSIRLCVGTVVDRALTWLGLFYARVENRVLQLHNSFIVSSVVCIINMFLVLFLCIYTFFIEFSII